MDDQSLPPQPPPPPLAPPPIITYPARRPASGNWVWKLLAGVFLVLFCLSSLSRAIPMRRFKTSPRTGVDRTMGLEEVTLVQTNSNNKIAVINVEGVITGQESDRATMNLVEYIDEQLKAAEKADEVKAVILKVNSPGGEVLASDDINSSIRRFQERSHKPVVASMGALAASGGYYVSAPCRWIVANELTITGSIGVIMHGYNYRLLMDKIGVRPHVYKSGKFKDMLSGEREPDSDKLSPQEQKNRIDEDKMVQAFIDETFNKFKDVVRTGRAQAAAQNSGSGHTLAGNWQDYADGRILSGKRAMDLGFVDELGDFQVAVKRAQTLANIPSATLVSYRVPFDFQSVFSRVFGKTEAPALKVDLGLDLPQLKAGLPYYILPIAVAH